MSLVRVPTAILASPPQRDRLSLSALPYCPPRSYLRPGAPSARKAAQVHQHLPRRRSPRSRRLSVPQPAEARVLPTRFRALHADPQPCVCVLYARSDEPPAQIARSTHASTCPPRASPRQPGLLHLQLLPPSAPGARISLGRLSFTCAAIQRSWRRHLGSTLMISLTTSIALYCDHHNLKTVLRAPLLSSLSTRRRCPHTQPPRQQSSGD